MNRCVVSLLLLPLPCVLLIQSASLVHGHGGAQPAGHDLHPHFHTDSDSSSHSAHHGPEGRHRHDGAKALLNLSGEREIVWAGESEPVSEHEADAVFVAMIDAVVAERFQVGDEAVSSIWRIGHGAHFFDAFWSRPPDPSALWGRPPPPESSFGPLYVRHLSLLI